MPSFYAQRLFPQTSLNDLICPSADYFKETCKSGSILLSWKCLPACCLYHLLKMQRDKFFPTYFLCCQCCSTQWNWLNNWLNPGPGRTTWVLWGFLNGFHTVTARRHESLLIHPGASYLFGRLCCRIATLLLWPTWRSFESRGTIR